MVIKERLFEIEDENVDDIQKLATSYLERKIHLTRYDRMVKDIVVSLNEEEYILDPDFQRKFVWDNDKCSKLIESIIINVPIPNLYASYDDENKWIIVDGVQRLTSLQKFYNNKFKLSKLEILPEINGKTYSELDDKYRKNLDKGNLSIILLDNGTSIDIKFDIFMRLNTGGEPLTNQELRNCLYRGPLNDCIKNELTNNKIFRTLLNDEGKYYNRMEDVELVLRFISLYNDYDFNNSRFITYNGNLKSYMNIFMEKHRNDTIDSVNLYKKVFDSAVDKIYKIYGETAFFGHNNAFNKSIYDMLMLTFSYIEIDDIDINEVKLRTKDLIDDPIFAETLKHGTTSKKNIIYRIHEFNNIISVCMKK